MNCTFVDNHCIEIGDNVLIASNVQIYTATHSTDVHERMVWDWQEGDDICYTIARPVRIENGVWIGVGRYCCRGDYRKEFSYRCWKCSDSFHSCQLRSCRKPMSGHPAS